MQKQLIKKYFQHIEHRNIVIVRLFSCKRQRNDKISVLIQLCGYIFEQLFKNDNQNQDINQFLLASFYLYKICLRCSKDIERYRMVLVKLMENQYNIMQNLKTFVLINDRKYFITQLWQDNNQENLFKSYVFFSLILKFFYSFNDLVNQHVMIDEYTIFNNKQCQIQGQRTFQQIISFLEMQDIFLKDYQFSFWAEVDKMFSPKDYFDHLFKEFASVLILIISNEMPEKMKENQMKLLWNEINFIQTNFQKLLKDKTEQQEICYDFALQYKVMKFNYQEYLVSLDENLNMENKSYINRKCMYDVSAESNQEDKNSLINHSRFQPQAPQESFFKTGMYPPKQI